MIPFSTKDWHFPHQKETEWVLEDLYLPECKSIYSRKEGIACTNHINIIKFKCPRLDNHIKYPFHSLILNTYCCFFVKFLLTHTVKTRAVDCLIQQHTQACFFVMQYTQRKVASSRLSQLHSSTLKHFQTVYEAEVGCLCTVTFEPKSSKLNSRLVYCSRLYGTCPFFNFTSICQFKVSLRSF